MVEAPEVAFFNWGALYGVLGFTVVILAAWGSSDYINQFPLVRWMRWPVDQLFKSDVDGVAIGGWLAFLAVLPVLAALVDFLLGGLIPPVSWVARWFYCFCWFDCSGANDL